MLQGVDGSVDNRRDDGFQIQVVFVQPHFHQAADGGAQVGDGQVDVEVAGQFVAGGAAEDDFAQLLFPQGNVFFLHGHDGFVFFRIFAFQMGDDEEFVVQLVVLDVDEDAVQQLPQALFVGFLEAV